jgi:hypothetical protein
MITTAQIPNQTADLAGLLDKIGSPGGKAQVWDEVVKRLDTQIQRTSATETAANAPIRVNGIAQLGEMMKLQVDVHRAQMRVELLSKVSESAMAAMRKLQQNQ